MRPTCLGQASMPLRAPGTCAAPTLSRPIPCLLGIVWICRLLPDEPPSCGRFPAGFQLNGLWTLSFAHALSQLSSLFNRLLSSLEKNHLRESREKTGFPLLMPDTALFSNSAHRKNASMQQNSDIHEEIPILYVIQIILDVFVNQVIAVAAKLPEPGNSRLYL